MSQYVPPSMAKKSSKRLSRGSDYLSELLLPETVEEHALFDNEYLADDLSEVVEEKVERPPPEDTRSETSSSSKSERRRSGLFRWMGGPEIKQKAPKMKAPVSAPDSARSRAQSTSAPPAVPDAQPARVALQGPGYVEMRPVHKDADAPVALGGVSYVPYEIVTDRLGFIWDYRRVSRERAVIAEDGDESLSSHTMDSDLISSNDSENTGNWKTELTRIGDAGMELLCHTPLDMSNNDDQDTQLNLRSSTTRKTSSVSVQSTEMAFSPPKMTHVKSDLENKLMRATGVRHWLFNEREKSWNSLLREVNDIKAGTSRTPESQMPHGQYTVLTELLRLPDGPTYNKRFRKLVAHGVPIRMRADIWAVCSGASTEADQQLIDDALEKKLRTDVAIVQSDASRTLRNNVFYTHGRGVAILTEVLEMYQVLSKTGYIQGMNLIAGNLLLIVGSSREVFWLLWVMVEHLLPDACFKEHGMKCFRDAKIASKMIERELPELYNHMLSLLDIEQKVEASVLFDWFASGFARCLTGEALFRVWDVVFCLKDRSDFLYCLAMVLFKLNQENIMDIDDGDELYTYLRTSMVTRHAYTIDAVVKAALAVKRKTVAEAREIVEAEM